MKPTRFARVGFLAAMLPAAAIALALTAPAMAGTFTYRCEHGESVTLDTTANTITWRGHVFSLHEADYNPDVCAKDMYQGTDSAGSTATLCTATQGAANVDITSPERHFVSCQVKRVVR